MPRRKGTLNTPQTVVDEIMKKHENGVSTKELSEEYDKPLKTIKNMITRENNKKRNISSSKNIPKQRGRKPAKTLQELKYENRRLKMENDLMRDFLSLIEGK